MTRQSTIRLTVAVVLTVAGALVAITAGRPEAAVLVAPWTVLLVIGLSGARHQEIVAAVSVESDRVIIGDEVEIVTSVRGASGWVEASTRPDAELWPADGADGTGGERRSTADIADPTGTTELRCTLTAATWGTHDLGRVGLRVTEPYGLLRWTGLLYQPTTVRVHPRPVELQELLAPWFVRRSAGNHASRTVGPGVEYADIRPFTSGDSQRDINWRASARSDELLVSQRHPDRSTDVVLLVDSFVESGHTMRAVFGLAIEAAVALADSHLAVTDRVGLIELGGIVRWVSPGTGKLQLQRLTDALLATRLYAYAADRDISLVPPRAIPPRSFVLALSPLYDHRFVDSLFALRAGGHDVAVVDCSPVGDELLGSGTSSESAGLALQIWLAERGVTRDLLAEQGVAVGRWREGDDLDLVLGELIRRRRRAMTVVRR